MSHYLVYWKASTVVAGQHLNELKHSASNQYDRLQIGDVLWIVTSEDTGDLVLVGRQTVDRIVGQIEAERLLGGKLWDAEYHVISDKPEVKEFIDISRFARRLVFDGGVETLPRGFTGKNLQTMRRLYDGSANDLDKLWSQRHLATPMASSE